MQNTTCELGQKLNQARLDGKEIYIYCPYCKKNEVMIDDPQAHFKLIHPTYQFKSNCCYITFKDRSNRKRHQDKQFEKTYLCEKCKTKFTRLDSLINHQKNKTACDYKECKKRVKKQNFKQQQNNYNQLTLLSVEGNPLKQIRRPILESGTLIQIQESQFKNQEDQFNKHDEQINQNPIDNKSTNDQNIIALDQDQQNIFKILKQNLAYWRNTSWIFIKLDQMITIWNKKYPYGDELIKIQIEERQKFKVEERTYEWQNSIQTCNKIWIAMEKRGYKRTMLIDGCPYNSYFNSEEFFNLKHDTMIRTREIKEKELYYYDNLPFDNPQDFIQPARFNYDNGTDQIILMPTRTLDHRQFRDYIRPLVGDELIDNLKGVKFNGFNKSCRTKISLVYLVKKDIDQRLAKLEQEKQQNLDKQNQQQLLEEQKQKEREYLINKIEELQSKLRQC